MTDMWLYLRSPELATTTEHRMSAEDTRIPLLEGLLDGLLTPAMLLGSAGQMLYANPACEAWLFDAGVSPQSQPGGRSIAAAALPRDAVCTPAELHGDRGFLVQRPSSAQQIDPVSGLPNAAAAFSTLTKTLRSVAALGNRLCVIHLNMESVRRMGASRGRQQALELERAVGQRIGSLARRGDFVCSLGQGSYCVLSLGCDQVEDALTAASRWVEALSRPYTIAGRDVVCGVAAGVAVAPEHGLAAADLLDHAASAAQLASEAGRNEVRVFAPAWAQALADDLDLESALAQGIEQGQLSLVYQPKFELEPEGLRPRLVGAEALVRWNHPERGLISPARFIPLAERSGLMQRLGAWVMDSACSQIARWQRLGLRVPAVAINVSGQQLVQGDFRWQVERCLSRHGLSASAISLEITESALLADVEESIRLLASLQAMGLSIAIDDFGTGFSSLAYLRRFPADVLKIDRTFVIGIDSDSQAAGILSAIVAMARTLGLELVVEGVENDAQRRALGALGCVLFQGFLFGRPERAESFAAAWLQAGAPSPQGVRV